MEPVLGYTESGWQERTDHKVVVGSASWLNGPGADRLRCHAIVDPTHPWPGNRLCHLPIKDNVQGRLDLTLHATFDTRRAYRHESFAEFGRRIGVANR